MRNMMYSMITRRALLSSVAAAAAVPGILPAAAKSFPKGFLWGAATAGHQVEGNNLNSDLWLLEHLPESTFAEPSGDACDQCHLYPHDIRLLAELGFNTYRFSLEWSRIEPEEGLFSRAELEHYRRVLAACHEAGVTPMVTYSHFTVPRWFAFKGGWEKADAPARFAKFCERATRSLGDMIGYATTLNEPDAAALLDWMNLPGGMSIGQMIASQLPVIRKQLGAPDFSGFIFADRRLALPNLLRAHIEGREAIKSVRPGLPVGVSLAMSDDQPASSASRVEEKRAAVYGPFLEAARKDDFFGVQTYTRAVVAEKDLPPPKDAELTQTGWEFYPEALEHTIRYAALKTGVPIMVTENGIATDDDGRRVEYIRRALAGVQRCLDDRVDVRGYIHWSLIDNFEWNSGFKPKFGLVAVDRDTQMRTVKPSAAYLGNIARRNAL
jgi:beta-glucosidase